jgi:hypothetical protein
MPSTKPFLAVLISVLLGSASARAQVLAAADLRDDPKGPPGHRVLETRVNICGGVKLNALIEETAKGNGLLSIANLKLKVIDEHDDGAVYSGAMPRVEFADIDDDGLKDLVVSGIVEYTDEKSDTVRERESFVFIYRFDAKAEKFRLSYKHASFALEDGPRSKA